MPHAPCVFSCGPLYSSSRKILKPYNILTLWCSTFSFSWILQSFLYHFLIICLFTYLPWYVTLYILEISGRIIYNFLQDLHNHLTLKNERKFCRCLPVPWKLDFFSSYQLKIFVNSIENIYNFLCGLGQKHHIVKTWSSPRCPLRSNYLVCTKNNLIIVGIPSSEQGSQVTSQALFESAISHPILTSGKFWRQIRDCQMLFYTIAYS